MILEDNEEYSIIVPDYLLESDLEEEENTAPVDYSDTLSDIVINQQTNNELLEEVISNQEIIISSHEKLYSGLSAIASLQMWLLVASVGLFFGRFFMSFFKGL